ncbi:hypothetical protein LCGC14_0932230 [marine sediment metagenome]|uniref:Uncharacterized protein n=1 Tax=marine sediment metagenome TaxID=412755 RepID=A0A0F9P8L5_9ZZZZ
MDNKPIVFLDIDGVLSGEYVSGGDWLTKSLIERLNQIVLPTCAEVILSSSWRTVHSLQEIEARLRFVGYKGQLDGATPMEEESRGLGIAEFLRNYPGRHTSGYGSVTILDDDGDMAPLEHRHVKIDVRFGLRDEDVEKALRFIAGDPFDPEVEL